MLVTTRTGVDGRGLGMPAIALPDAPRLKRALTAFSTFASMPKLNPGSVTGAVDFKTVASTLQVTKFVPGLKDILPSEFTSIMSTAAPYLDDIWPWVQKALNAPGVSQIPYVGDVADTIADILDMIKQVVTTASGGIAVALELYMAAHGGQQAPPVPPPPPDVNTATMVTVASIAWYAPKKTVYPPGTIATPIAGGGYRVAIPRGSK